MAKFELTIVIPTFNEGDIIKSALKRISDELPDLRSQIEIIVADDGKDDLLEVVKRCGASFGFGSVKVMHNDVPNGKGGSIMQAFRESHGAIVGFIDVDFSVSPTFIPDAVREIKNGGDICIASRVGNRWKSDKSLTTSMFATLFGFTHRWLVFFGSGRSFSDTQCGFKFFRHEVALDLFRDLVARDGLADLEILLKAVQRGYKVGEIKVPRVNDREGKRKLSRIFVNETLSLGRIFFKYRMGFGLRAERIDQRN